MKFFKAAKPSFYMMVYSIYIKSVSLRVPLQLAEDDRLESHSVQQTRFLVSLVYFQPVLKHKVRHMWFPVT